MTVYSVAIADTENILVLDLAYVFDHEVRILVRFGWLVGNVACSRLNRILDDYVAQLAVNQLILHKVLLALNS